MKRITVHANYVALVTKRGKLIDVLTEGRYWIGFNREVILYNMTKPLHINPEMIIYLENDRIQQLIGLVEIEDQQIGLEKRDGLFTRVLEPGLVAYWKSAIKFDVQKVDLASIGVPQEVPKYILAKPALLQYYKVYPVEAGQKGLLYIDGQFVRLLNPGAYYFWKSEKVITVKTVDVRVQLLAVVGQEILTKDKAGIRINYSTQFQVSDIEKAMVDAKDYSAQLYTAIQLVLRAYIGGMTLDQLLANKEAVGPFVAKEMEDVSARLGVKIISGGIKDIILPGDVKDIMSQVLIAQKKAQANTIMRQEETASTRSLLNTAKLMDDNTMLLKLKEMEYMEKIADKIGEITVNGGSRVMDQLRELVIAK